MTREEAIKNREECLKYLEGIGEKASFECVEAVKWSIKALRAYHHKLDRSRWEGCDYCENQKIREILLNNGRKYCSICGRPLTEEAWAEQERKMFENQGELL